MNVLKVRMKPYIQPFERVLALRELHALAGDEPFALWPENETSVDFEVRSLRPHDDFTRRLAYWEIVECRQQITVTEQSMREATVNLVRNGVALDTLRQQLPFQNTVPLPNRRCLRYGTHGLHEYRGKFFPQLVRALINISGTQHGGIVADPMSGSGTTVVEAVLSGNCGRGLDMNPLSVFMGNAKVKLMSANADRLRQGYERIRDQLLAAESRKRSCLPYFENLPEIDQKYLSAWFSSEALAGLDDISRAIQELDDEHTRDFMRVALSNILRRVSWQKDDDLRVRKEIRLDVEIDPKKEFLEEIGRSIRTVLAFLFQNGPVNNPNYVITEGDARSCGEMWGANSVDVVITSPPYATALPYLDTDRLSLCYLGLLPRPEHRSRDQQMIGNREVSEGLRKQYWERFRSDQVSLPARIQELIHRIEVLNTGANVGFRRRNLPALLAKYFFDMRDVLQGIFDALKPGHTAFVVVGNNHTVAGGHRVDIQTASLLKDIAESIGFEVAESLSMDMLVSRDIFKKNAMASEEILAFRKPV
jgi:site-specific DNA-methyltransferase (cytosine-N4-specific)